MVSESEFFFISCSYVFFIFADLLELPLPFESDWTPSMLQKSFVYYMLALMEEIKQQDSITKISVLLKNRYLEDYDDTYKGVLPPCDEGNFPCTKFTEYAKKTATILLTNVKRYIREDSGSLSKLKLESSDEVIPLLDSHNDEDYASQVIALKACDFIEKVAMFVASMVDPDSNLAKQVILFFL